ncbi:MAG: restriction endonuclease subunit S [Deltaproteobacteria bacterium]|nr:restriction endonuclease subunit S [Candidatus Desulfobacula maris]
MSGRYQAYSEYEESGVEWLGKVPTHWEIKRLGQFFEERREKVSDKDFSPLSVTMQGIVPQLETAAKTDAGDNRKLVLRNDFVINSRSDRKGSSGVSPYDGSVSLISIVLAPKRIHPDFVHHLLRSYPFQEEFYRYGKGIVADLWSTNSSEMKNILIPDIPEDEQQQIANFLDHETSNIDALIEKQQQLIKLLKEKRQAVISHAVTKGLNPDAPMKNSGVEWLGEVPEGWEVRTIAHLSNKITNGYVGPTRDILVDEGVSYVQATHIKQGKVNFDGAFFVRKIWSESHSKSILSKGDVLIVQTGAGTGDIGLVSENEEGFNCHALIIVEPDKKIISGDYLSMALQSQYGYSKLFSIRTGGMHPHLNCGEVQYVKLPIPPIFEQDQITTFIEEQIIKFDLLVKKQLEAISLLQERRTALTSAAVTGKIDIRNWQPPEQTQINKEDAI